MRTYQSFIVAVCLLAGQAVLADDSMDRATSTDHEKMADCIRKQQSGDVNMSKSQLKQFCKDELKRQKANGTMPTPPTDTPKQPSP
jgi:hypothetical protein